MAKGNGVPKSLTVKNLAELKRIIRPGTEFLTIAHSKQLDVVGLARVVSEVQSNAFYSKIKAQLEHKFSICNHGRGFRTDFGRAGDYIFDGTTVKVLDARKRDGSVLFEFEIYDRTMTMKEKKMEGTKIKQITTDNLRRMDDHEGLILQGCGGDMQEWVDGINETLTEAGILLNGSKFKNISTFQHNGLTCLLFDFEGVELNIAKFAMWRLQTHGNFGGTWLSDYVPNQLGGFIQVRIEKPGCELTEQDVSIAGPTEHGEDFSMEMRM